MTTNGTILAVTSTAVVTQTSTFFTSTSIPSSTTTIQPATPSISSTPSSTPSSISSSSATPTSTSSAPPPAVAPVTPTTTPPAAAVVTSVITQQPTTSNGAVLPATTIFVTSTASITPTETAVTTSPRSASTTTTSSAASATTTGTGASNNAGGLSAGGKIAVAVVVPVVAVALIVLGLLFFWRRRKQRKDAEELRRKEVEEYGFNPNNDPTLPAVGAGGSFGDEPSEMKETDGSGYRGWGATPVATATRKPSGTLSSGNGNGNGAIGVATSDSGSNPGGYSSGSPTNATAPNSDVQSGDPLVGSPNGRPNTAGSETLAALGAAPAALSNSRDIHRGPSNASSAYSAANRSDASGELPVPGAAPGTQYYNDGMYYDEGIPQHGPYGDGTYGGGQPVIRDVQARRNTRIENQSVFPQQGNVGIAQNF